MNLLLDAFWRALAYCLLPRIMALSLMPLVLMVGLMGALGYYFWEAAVAGVQGFLQSFALDGAGWAWLEYLGAADLKSVLAPMIVIGLVTPVVVVLSLLLVALLMTPVIVQLVAQRRFAQLQCRKGASFWRSLGWSLASCAMALAVMAASVPLWFIPPLVLVLPPLIWGWLTYRVMAFDALAEHASFEERRAIFRRHRAPLVGMGVLVGYMGAAPSLIWSFGVVTIVMAPLLVPVSIWIYTLVFAFSSLWFTHYCLAALEQLRREQGTDQV